MAEDNKKDEKIKKAEVTKADLVVENSDIKKPDNKKVESIKEELNDKIDLTDVSKAKADDDELPEDIKKKIEKKKSERIKKKTKKRKKGEVIKIKSGKAFIKATYNNTIVTLTDLQGNVISWASAGMAGFKGPKKSTPYAAQIITKIATMKAKEEYGLEEVIVFVKGVGTGRESAIRALNANGINIMGIKDVTPIPHNGCRPKKPRRV